MKVRACPSCGKHNPENSWSCADCGATLSMNTLIDLEDSSISHAENSTQTGLAGISSAFHQDVANLLVNIDQAYETVDWGCDVTQISKLAPYIFGYLLITSRRMIYVYFAADLVRHGTQSVKSMLIDPLAYLIKETMDIYIYPKRPYRLFGLELCVAHPYTPLSHQEIASRKEVSYQLKDLASVSYGYTNTEPVMVNQTARFLPEGEIQVTFFAPHQAQKGRDLLAPWLPKLGSQVQRT